MNRIKQLLLGFCFLTVPLVADFPKEKPIPTPYLMGDWGGIKSRLFDKGIEIKVTLEGDGTWNLDGGKKRTTWGDYEYLFDASVKVYSDPLLHYQGGTLFAEYTTHGGPSPSTKYVGSFIAVDDMESPHFDILYALWYKQTFGKNNSWILIGKSDAYDHFTTIPRAAPFFNSGYTTLPPAYYIFPTYPYPAMSVVGALVFPHEISLRLGVYDGSLAEGLDTGKHGVFGHFFNDLPSHAFLIGELDFVWRWCSLYKGRLGLGAWKSTAKFHKFGGGEKRGTSGPYLTFDQVIHKHSTREVGVFGILGSGNPSVNPVHYSVGVGLTGIGLLHSRPLDTLGIGMSRVNFSRAKGSGFTESYEASYEIFYQMQLDAWGYLEPDFQYIVHPGGQGLPNASVVNLRLQLRL